MKSGLRRTLGLMLAGIMIAAGLTACAGKGEAVDGAGHTRIEGLGRSLEEQFEAVRREDARMRELMTEAQLHYESGVWWWGSKGVSPWRGLNVWSLELMIDDETYYLQIGRSIFPLGATGARDDLKPMVDYFLAKGWAVYETAPDDHLQYARADTGEGYWFEWQVQANGQYNLTLYSETFWGYGDDLLREIADRIPAGATAIEESEPGVYLDFPNWADPLVNVPEL